MLKFDERNHEYTLDGKKLISVTQLMRKHNLAPSYDGIDQRVLEKKAEYGSFIHEEIDKWIKHKELGFSVECQEFIDYEKTHNMEIVANEYQVHNDIVAGTLDLMYVENGTPIIADFKTTYKIHKESVSWQLSIYLYLYLLDQNNALIQYESFKGQCFHFGKDKKLKVINIPLKAKALVEDLIDSERNEGNYQLKPLDINLAEIEMVERTIKYYEELKKEAEKKEAELKEAIIKAMVENGIQEYENEHIKLTYIAETTRATLDSKAIKEKYPEIYHANLKESKVKENVRITIRGEKNE